MPVYQLPRLPLFPDPEDADESGILAVGGDLSPIRLLSAYRQGIFPWFEADQPIIWWCPDPRLILDPDGLKISKSLRKTIRRGIYEVRMDTDFAGVIRQWAALREDPGTWITTGMEQAYLELHRLGLAHSVESWHEGTLVGGLYGVYLGRCFFGESMFSTRSDASKVALYALVHHLQAHKLEMIDCQISSSHLLSLGAVEIPRRVFLQRLRRAMGVPTDRALWHWSPDTLRLPK